MTSNYSVLKKYQQPGISLKDLVNGVAFSTGNAALSAKIRLKRSGNFYKAKEAFKPKTRAFALSELAGAAQFQGPPLLLAQKLPWERLEREFAPLYAEEGRPAKPVSVVVMGWSRSRKAATIGYHKTYERRPSHEDRYHHRH